MDSVRVNVGEGDVGKRSFHDRDPITFGYLG